MYDDESEARHLHESGRGPHLPYQIIYNIQQAENINSGTNHGNINQSSTQVPALHQSSTSEVNANPDWIVAGSLSLLGILREFLFPISSGGRENTRRAALASLSEKATSAVTDTLDTDFCLLSIDDSLEPPSRPYASGPAFYEIYVRALLAEGLGLPCWEPRPLEPDAQPNGVVPGDIGTYTAEDGFQKIFNLWDDLRTFGPIAAKTSPDKGHWMPLQDIITRRNYMRKGETLVRGASTDKQSHSKPPLGVTYEFHRDCTAPPGAILALTSAADKEATRGLEEIEEYIKHNGEAIYRHANSLRAIGKNESLYIITGCIKSASWAMAAYDESMDPHHRTLRLVPVVEANDGEPPEYEWRSQGSSRARVGKSDQRRVKDQALFLQGFKMAFSSQFRARVKAGISGGNDSEAPGPADTGADDREDPSAPPDRVSRSISEAKNSDGGGTTGLASQSRHRNTSVGSSGPPSQGFSSIDPSSDAYDVHYTAFPPRIETEWHPSDVINAHLLRETGCDIAICHDDSWRYLLASHIPSTGVVARIDAEAVGLEVLSTTIGTGNSEKRNIGIQNGLAFLLPGNSGVPDTVDAALSSMGVHTDQPLPNRQGIRSNPPYIPCKVVEARNAKPRAYILSAGLVEGVVPGDFFDLFETSPLGKEKEVALPFDMMVAIDVGTTSTVLQCLPARTAPITSPNVFYAKRVAWSTAPASIYCKDRELIQSLSKVATSCPATQRGRILSTDLADDPTKASLILSVEGDTVYLDRNDPVLNAHVPKRIPYALNRNVPEDIFRVISAWRHFKYHLHRKGRDEFSQIRMELHYLQPENGDWDNEHSQLKLVGNNLLAVEPAHAITSDEQLARPMGFTVYNDGDGDVYVHLLFFDPTDLTITPISFANEDSGEGESEPPLLAHSKRESDPLEFTLEDDQTRDIGYFKLFITRSPVDLECLWRLDSPFRAKARGDKEEEVQNDEAAEAIRLHAEEELEKMMLADQWGVKLATVIHSRPTRRDKPQTSQTSQTRSSAPAYYQKRRFRAGLRRGRLSQIAWPRVRDMRRPGTPVS